MDSQGFEELLKNKQDISCTTPQLSNPWWMPNSISKGFGPVTTIWLVYLWDEIVLTSPISYQCKTFLTDFGTRNKRVLGKLCNVHYLVLLSNTIRQARLNGTSGQSLKTEASLRANDISSASINLKTCGVSSAGAFPPAPASSSESPQSASLAPPFPPPRPPLFFLVLVDFVLPSRPWAPPPPPPPPAAFFRLC